MREKLLVIGASVPRYDENSGDLRLFSILEIISRYYDITYFPNFRNWEELDTEKKYTECLENLGISVAKEGYSILDILRRVKYRSVLIEFFALAENYLPRVRIIQPKCSIAIDTVDVHFSRLFLKYQITKDIKDLREAERTKKREMDVYRKADMVIAITEEDSGVLLKECFGLNIRIIPNIHRIVPPVDTAAKEQLIFVGGFRHEPNADAVLYFCKDILPLIRERVQEVKFAIVGSNPPEQIKELANDFIAVTGYVRSVTPYLQKSYISVAPLRYGAGMKGKIGEAMAHGIPVVTTSIGGLGMGLVNRENAMIADNPGDFADSVIELMQNHNLYRKIQRGALEHVRNNYTEVEVCQGLLSIMADLGKGPVKKMPVSEKVLFLIKYTLGFAKKQFDRRKM